MKYRELEYSRTFNLGQYESEKIGLLVDLDETEDIDEAFKTMKGQVFKLHEEGELLEDSNAAVEADKQPEKTSPRQNLWNLEKIRWVEAEGARGLYQRYPAPHQKAESTLDYRNMLADLKAHDGKMTRDGYFFWTFADGATIGRKKLS